LSSLFEKVFHFFEVALLKVEGIENECAACGGFGEAENEFSMGGLTEQANANVARYNQTDRKATFEHPNQEKMHASLHQDARDRKRLHLYQRI
jgi:hypothetical protein